MTKERSARSFFSDETVYKAYNAVFPFAFVLILLYNNISYTFVHIVHKTGEEKVKDFLEILKDFCGENYIWILVGAVALLLLIIAAVTGAALRHTRRNNDSESHGGERDYFLEGEYDLLLRSKTGAKQAIHGECDESVDEIREDDDENSEYEEYEPEKELESLNNRPVCININIEHGKVNIEYGADGETTCSIAETEMAPDKTDEETEETVKQEESQRQEIVLEKINLIKGKPVRKFGPDNLNTGRSGRIYTEEELCRLIKE